MTGSETVAVVVVTYNRADLLVGMLDGLAAQTRAADAVIVIDNASTDHTRAVLDARTDLPLHVTTSEANLGGAGGFHLGVRAAYDAGYDRVWLMDDDVVPAPDCLAVLMAVDEDCLIAVREDLAGTLVEKAAIDFDLRNPLAVRPKRAAVDTAYADRASMPELVEVQNVAFEGFMVRRERHRPRSASPTPPSSSSTTTRSTPSAPAGPGAGSGGSATPCSCGSSTSTSSTTSRGGRASTCTATSSWCTCATGRTPSSGSSRG